LCLFQEQLTWSDIPTSSFNRDRRDETSQYDLDGTASSKADYQATGDDTAEQGAVEGALMDASTKEDEVTADDVIADEDGFDDFDDFAEGEEDDDTFGDFDEASNDTFEPSVQEHVSESPSMKTTAPHQPVSSVHLLAVAVTVLCMID